MNRKQRCSQSHSKSITRKAGLTYVTAASVIGGSLGMATPALAIPQNYVANDCATLRTGLSGIVVTGGTLTANFSDTCNFSEGYIFSFPTEINGPANGELILGFTGSNSFFTAQNEFDVSNVIFKGTKGTDNPSSFQNFIYSGLNPSPITVTKSTFSDAEFIGGDALNTPAAIYAEGNLTVTDSAFTNLANVTTSGGLPAAIFSLSLLTVKGSTFSDNRSDAGVGAILALSSADIDNSTFINNQGEFVGALLLSEGGGVVSNSTFWNNSGTEPLGVSIAFVVPQSSFLFANILANTDGKPVVYRGVVDNPLESPVDLGANLFTDTSFVSTTNGEGASKLVSLDDLKLSELALNQTMPTNTGKTKTVAIGAGSIARDYYSATSAGINPTNNSGFATRITSLDQRGVTRQTGARYDVGAYEAAVDTAAVAKQKIKFAPGSSKLSKDAKKQLRRLATEIQTKNLKSITLEGYTATFTKASPAGKIFRVKLSKARTAAVEKYLKQQFKKSGYSVRFTKSPKGAANPVKSNKTEKGRKDNRRVEIVVN